MRCLAAALLAPLILVAAAPAPPAGAAEDRSQNRTQNPAQDRAEARRLDREIERLRSELVALGGGEQANRAEAEAQKARLAELSAREAEVRSRIGRNRGQLARLLGALQMHRRNPPPPLLVNPASARDAVRAAILIRAITPELEARGQAFAEEAEEIARLRRGAATASESLFAAESEAADLRARIDALTARKRGLEQALYDDEVAEARARLAGDRAGTVEELAQGLAQGSGALPGRAPERLLPPVPGEAARRFGAAEARGRSQGWTWRTPPETVVLSPAAGRVEYAGPLKGWGLVVILRLGGGYQAVLAGMHAVGVGVGRMVAAGEPIGRMAPDSAQASEADRPAAPELYLELRNRAAPVDPARWLVGGAKR